MNDETPMNDEQFFEQFQWNPRPEFSQQLHERLKMEEQVENELLVHAPQRIIQPIGNQSFVHNLSIVETILRSRQEFFAEIREGIGLPQKIMAMMFSSAVFLSIYGGVTGLTSANHALPQMFSSAVKVPVLFLITLIICSPSLYFFNLLFGSKQTISQTFALIMTAITTTSVLLVSFAPVTLFFLTTGGATGNNYSFMKLLTVAIFGVSGLMGIAFLRQGFAASVDADNLEGRDARRALFLAWVVLYAFVGSQMAWTLRPYLGAPGQEFEIIRAGSRSNFYENVLDSAQNFLNGE